MPEPPITAAVICENSISALQEEQLYDFPLNVGFDDPAARLMRRLCVSTIGIESPELEPAFHSDLPLTSMCQSSKPVPESKTDNITSRAPEHKGVVFSKSPPKVHDTSPWPGVVKIVRGLGIPCEDYDFPCPIDCDTPEDHIENQSKKPEPDHSWSFEPIPTPSITLSIKLLSTMRNFQPEGVRTQLVMTYTASNQQ